MKPKKIARMWISIELLEMFIKGGYGTEPGMRIETTAPEDLQIFAITMYPWHVARTVEVYFTSETLEEIEEGEEVPKVQYQYTMIQDDTPAANNS